MIFENLPKFKEDYLATVHYIKNKNERLFKAEDKNKDQSYFLWKLNQKILKKALFPNGDYLKSQIKETAKKLELPVSGASESQEICFISKNTENFLKKEVRNKKWPNYK